MKKRIFLKIAETAHRASSMEAAYSEHSIDIHYISMAAYVTERCTGFCPGGEQRL